MDMDVPNRRLVLFDMDSTLIKVSEWHWEAYRRTAQTVFGVDAAKHYQRGSHSGNTQRNLLQALARNAGLKETVIEARLDDATATLAATLIHILPADLSPYILPGVLPLLCALRQEGHALGLVTGSVGPSARTILGRSGLARFFPAYAFGDEGNARIELVHLAIERATEAFGWRPDTHSLVVVGDAPNDIRAGRDAGAWVVAVATGFFTEEALAQLGPDVVLPDLGDWQRARQAILDGRPG